MKKGIFMVVITSILSVAFIPLNAQMKNMSDKHIFKNVTSDELRTDLRKL